MEMNIKDMIENCILEKELGRIANQIGELDSMPIEEVEKIKEHISNLGYAEAEETLPVVGDFYYPDNHIESLANEAPEFKDTEKLTPFDKSVFNAVVSIFAYNESPYFTAKQIATYLFYGDNPCKSQPSKKQVELVKESIEKQSKIDMSIKLVKQEGLEFSGAMLPVREIAYILYGQKVRGYEMTSTPPLHEYAMHMGLVSNIPSSMLNVPMNLTSEKLVIRDYLLREIGHIMLDSDWNNIISVDTILKQAYEDPKGITRNKRKKELVFIRTALDCWKEKKIIKGYTENKKGRKIISFTIANKKSAHKCT